MVLAVMCNVYVVGVTVGVGVGDTELLGGGRGLTSTFSSLYSNVDATATPATARITIAATIIMALVAGFIMVLPKLLGLRGS